MTERSKHYSAQDRRLGMDAPIQRRDFLNGVLVGGGALATGLAGGVSAHAASLVGLAQSATPALDPYPPRRTGMRGAHPGAFEDAHALRDGVLSLNGAVDQNEVYDLVIVGGGLSGLSAAHFYHRAMNANGGGPGQKVLILDNHDDFGGHAKRNEFVVNGKTIVCNGGTLNIESPERYNQWAHEVLTDIGIDVERYKVANTANHHLYADLGLSAAYAFDRETFGRNTGGKDAVVKLKRGRFYGFDAAVIDAAPLTEASKVALRKLVAKDQPDYLPGLSVEAKKDWLARHSFREFLIDKVGLTEEGYWFFQDMGCGSFCVGADATPALYGWVQGYPGYSGMNLGGIPDGLFADLPGGIHGRQLEGKEAVHFPDGNATVARALVAKLIPDAAPGVHAQEDLGMAHFAYDTLDRPENPTRIRLSSIAVHVEHVGNPANASEVAVRYMNHGKLKQVRGRAVILASWNMMIPYIMPELPQPQKDALAYGVKGPLVYSSIALTNWRAFKNLGVARFDCPTMFHNEVGLTEAATLGGLTHAANPDEPVVAHLVKYCTKPGLPRRDQHRAARADLLATSYETFERETRAQLQRLLGPGGFDAKRDIAAITINRWPHGYAYTYNSIYDPVEWVYTETPTRPCVVGRQPFGLVSIANSDAAASPHTDAAMLEAHRAVQEVIERKTYPFAPRRLG